MKVIQNKKTDMNIVDINNKPMPNATYFNILTMMVNNPPTNPQGVPLGFSLPEMRLRDKLLTKIESGKQTIELEDAEFNKLMECHDAFTWRVIHKGCMELGDYLEGVKQGKEEKKKE